ncbi:hypothetical protein VMCG_08505 [Cytospora schulzeri]|uniref:Uncharacterized protein n=1 Tax=Cytospora schulzeri TaxID=448051 RepID=A0A423VWJ2_9PEZI|nr:hypothetical protein VMCG_08505 [Valsa malicola]
MQDASFLSRKSQASRSQMIGSASVYAANWGSHAMLNGIVAEKVSGIPPRAVVTRLSSSADIRIRRPGAKHGNPFDS